MTSLGLESSMLHSCATEGIPSTADGICQNDGTSTASWYCSDCSLLLCDDCDRCFHANPSKKHHDRQPVKTGEGQTNGREALRPIGNTYSKLQPGLTGGMEGVASSKAPVNRPPNVVKPTRRSRVTSRRSKASLSHRKPKRRNIKVLVVGNSKCGKSSVIHRYSTNDFSEDYKTTIGADYFRKEVLWGDISCNLQLWDIAGQDRFASMTRPYYRNAAAAVVLCDVSRPETLNATRAWKRELDDKLDTAKNNVPVILIANKCDLVPSGEESILLGAKLSELSAEMGFCKWFLTSAKQNTKIEDAMSYLLQEVLISKGDIVRPDKVTELDSSTEGERAVECENAGDGIQLHGDLVGEYDIDQLKASKGKHAQCNTG